MSGNRNTSRALAVKLHVYERFGFGGVTRVAEGIEQSRQYVSGVLNGQIENESTLDKIETWLAEQPENLAA